MLPYRQPEASLQINKACKSTFYIKEMPLNSTSGIELDKSNPKESWYLEFEGICIIGAGGKICVNSGTTTKGPPVWKLLIITIFRFDTFSVAG